MEAKTDGRIALGIDKLVVLGNVRGNTNACLGTISHWCLPLGTQRSEVAPSVWERGQLMNTIEAVIAPNIDFGGASDDDIYWDNLNITVER